MYSEIRNAYKCVVTVQIIAACQPKAFSNILLTYNSFHCMSFTPNVYNHTNLWIMHNKSQTGVVFFVQNQRCAGAFYCLRWQKSFIPGRRVHKYQHWSKCSVTTGRVFRSVALTETGGTGKDHFTYLLTCGLCCPGFPVWLSWSGLLSGQIGFQVCDTQRHFQGL